MLESILNFKEVEKSPYLTFIWACLITTVAILFSTQILYKVTISGVRFNLTGMFSVLFTIIPSVFFLTNAIMKEEEMEEGVCQRHLKDSLWARHERDILMFLFYFLGVTLTFAVWTLVLPADFFQVQIMKINEIRAAVSGSAAGYAVGGGLPSFFAILLNNLEVMLFAFIFSLLFGAGAIFIIVWNASILGVAIGGASKTLLDIPIRTMYYLPHGIPEIIAYLCAGLGGGLLSVAVLKCKSTKVLEYIVFDSFKIFVLGLAFLVLAAGIEVYL